MAERERPVPSVVVGTAGHIDHGKTTLLRALTGIDADRLPEERRRGMTIDVGYAHLGLPDGRVVDFVDVPGHDRLVGNMLVGAGEIDAALLVVAADDGPNAQTLEHLELLDALGIADGLVVVTKADLAPDTDRRDALVAEVEALLARTSLARSPVLVASAQTGEGIEALRVALVALADRVAARASAAKGARLAVDRIFTVKGRGTVVTGSLRGGPIATGRRCACSPRASMCESARCRSAGPRSRPPLVAGRRSSSVASMPRPSRAASCSQRTQASWRHRGCSSPCVVRQGSAGAVASVPLATAIASDSTPARTRSTPSSCAGRARRSTSLTERRSRTSGSHAPSRPRRATGSRSATRHPARRPAAGSSSTRHRRAVCLGAE